MKTFSSISTKLPQLGKKHRDKGCDTTIEEVAASPIVKSSHQSFISSPVGSCHPSVVCRLCPP